MLTLTEDAGALLAEILNQEGVSQDVAIRLVYEGEGLAMQADNERPGDESFKHEGRTVLVIDQQISELLTDNTLDADGDRLMLSGGEEQQENE
jgi:hypothetical protein